MLFIYRLLILANGILLAKQRIKDIMKLWKILIF